MRACHYAAIVATKVEAAPASPTVRAHSLSCHRPQKREQPTPHPWVARAHFQYVASAIKRGHPAPRSQGRALVAVLLSHPLGQRPIHITLRWRARWLTGYPRGAHADRKATDSATKEGGADLRFLFVYTPLSQLPTRIMLIQRRFNAVVACIHALL